MKVWIACLFLTGCFLNHPQYCHSHDDCYDGQWCPSVRAPNQPADICQGKANIPRFKLGD